MGIGVLEESTGSFFSKEDTLISTYEDTRRYVWGVTLLTCIMKVPISNLWSFHQIPWLRIFREFSSVFSASNCQDVCSRLVTSTSIHFPSDSWPIVTKSFNGTQSFLCTPLFNRQQILRC